MLLITPYNAQVRALSEALPGFRIGTVDKFQGQEAPISIYSMATSSSEEAPHGMEFLYSLNRLNVATSRAQCVALVVASPTLLRVRCRTPHQIAPCERFGTARGDGRQSSINQGNISYRWWPTNCVSQGTGPFTTRTSHLYPL